MDTFAGLVDVGTTDANGDLKIYDGTPPSEADAALSGNTLCAVVELQDPAFGAAADDTPGAIITLLGVPLSDLSIDATSTGGVTFGRTFNRNNAIVAQYAVAESAADIIVNSDDFQAGAIFTLTAFTNTLPEE